MSDIEKILFSTLAIAYAVVWLAFVAFFVRLMYQKAKDYRSRRKLKK